ncbi:MAB_1171c family putative transporter [Pseudonocardia nantongensis]|uniref:MAB_1171c family putative transporter n=1 Tax=Pseudonocardia nantongensis TaxID=1181885 RepID=UPI00397CE3E2
MVSAVFLLVAALCAGTCVPRQQSWRARGRDGVTPLLPALVALGCAFVVIAPATQQVASAVVPGVGRLLSNCCTLVAAYGFSQMLGYLHGRDDPAPGGQRAGRGTVALVAVLAVLVVTFFLGDRSDAAIGLFDYRDAPALTTYVVVYALFLTLTLVRMLLLAGRAVTRTRHRLRIGMLVVAAGCVFGLAYSTSKISTTVLAYAGAGGGADRYCAGPFSRLDCTLDIGFPALSVGLIVLGLGVPFLLSAPGELRHRITDARLARSLRPLWHAMYAAVPQIALTSPGAVRGSVPRHDAALRLYRRTVEVRDGGLILQPYRSRDDTDEHARRARAAGLSGAHARVAVEAADLATAIERYRHETPAVRPPAPPEAAGHTDDVREEARWLARVSEALARHDIEPLPGGVAR